MATKYHPGTLCCKCFLCGSKHKYYDHYATFSDEEKQFIVKNLEGSHPPESSCICKADHVEASKHCSEDNYIPRWKRNDHTRNIEVVFDTVPCSYPTCTCTNRLIVPSFVSTEVLEAVLKVPPPHKLCNKHYQMVYRETAMPTVPCTGCGIKPLRGTAFTRHSPNAELICAHFFETAGFELHLTPTDYICSTCYKLHVTILESNDLPKQSLSEIIASMKEKLSNTQDHLASCIQQAAIYVAQSLLSDRALLLPDVSRMFLCSYGFELDDDTVTNASYELKGLEGIVKFSSRWLLQQLIIYLHEHLSYKCIHKKFGTILYNKRGDLLKSLSWALGSKGSAESSVSAFSLNSPNNESELLDDAGKIINALIHKEIDRISQSFTNSKFDPCSFKLKESIEAINPMLWRFLCTITKSVREYLGKAVPPSKEVMRYFLLCQLMHCANQQFLSPLHYILADTIELYGGSRKLMKLFNRLGIVCSTDTHDRIVTEIAENERAKQVSQSLIPNAFTVTSVDNIDILKSHAAVYCGDQGRSYHGTTIQIVQPNPLLLLTSGSMLGCTHNESMCTCTNNSSITELHVATAVTSALNESLIPIESAALNESVIPTESAALNESVIPTESAALNESCALIPTDSNYTCNYPDNMPNDSMLTMAIATHNLPDTTIAMTAPSNLHVADATSDLLLHYSKPPLPKKRRTVSVKHHLENISLHKEVHVHVINPAEKQVLTIGVEMNGFKENEKESNEKKKIEYRYLCYMYCKEALQSEKLLKPLHQFLSEETNLPTSNIYYMEVIDENPDSTETMKLVSELLLDEPALNIGGYTVVVGDGKTYTHLQKVKRLYGKEMTTLLIYPGDWHLLKNYQQVLLKIYYSAGLKELAEAAGFKGATLKALQNCSNFKHSHHFLLQTWESLYRVMLQQFLIDKPNVMGDISIIIKESELRNDTPINLIEHIKEYMGYKQYNSFLTFIEEHAIHDDTWQFWARFVFEDCMAYVNLFIAIRHRNWHLRIAAIKLMAPLFAAFDRTCLIPAHLADVQTYPKNVLECFENGGFAVSINGNGGRSVALDEAHEMCVNKDLKMAIARPTQAYLQKMSIYLRYRVTQHKNLINELFSKDNEQIPQPTLYEQESLIWKDEANIKSMTELIENFQLLPSSLESNRGLFNPFSKVHATAEQSHDLLNYRDIGNRQFEQYVTHRIAQTPSTSQAPVRKKRLLTMSSQKQKRKRETSKEKELHQVIKCIRRKMSWMNETGERFEPADEQYSVYPRAICDTDGSPHKGNKCIWTSKVESRYGNQLQVLSNNLPSQWFPQVVLIDGMFIINITPLRKNKTILDYSLMLYNRFIDSHYKAGATEVHIIFDNPLLDKFSPKVFERQRRDYNTSCSNDVHVHVHITFTPNLSVPSQWREYLNCRSCKRALVEAIGTCFMENTMHRLTVNQSLILAGCKTDHRAMVIRGGSILPDERYTSNAEEADMKLWKHALECHEQRILIYSPDTDVYNIGLSYVSVCDVNEIFVQLNLPHDNAQKYLNVKALCIALKCDPDLAPLPRDKVQLIFQMLYICTGCDYISFFKSIGKTTFLNAFYQHAEFITGKEMYGVLSDTNYTDRPIGFHSFLRLVGTVYFKKHLTAFLASGTKTPEQLYHSCLPEATDEADHHIMWYKRIRSKISHRIITEDERMPSVSALEKHWLRSCWVHQMWQNCQASDIYGSLPSPLLSGWVYDNGQYSIEWLPKEEMNNITKNIRNLTKGCSCKTGCNNKRCGCRKEDRHCNAGCECVNCTNLDDDPNLVRRDTESDTDYESTDNEDTS